MRRILSRYEKKGIVVGSLAMILLVSTILFIHKGEIGNALFSGIGIIICCQIIGDYANITRHLELLNTIGRSKK